jgi:DNA-binding HxlR family transcriptional regulator
MERQREPRAGEGGPGVAAATIACDAALVQVFSFLGKRWNGVILGTLVNGAVGFSALARRVEGISDSVLSDRLAELQAWGLVIRSVVPGPPVAVEYALSTSGEELVPALEELRRWAATHLPSNDVPIVR